MAAPSPSWSHANVITVLTRGDTATLDSLVRRNLALAALPWTREYDHAIFHEGDVSAASQSLVRARTGGTHRALQSMRHEQQPSSPCDLSSLFSAQAIGTLFISKGSRRACYRHWHANVQMLVLYCVPT